MNKAAVNLINWLKAKDCGKGEFANCIGVSKPSFSRMITGKQKPSIELAAEIERMTEGCVSIKDWTIPVSKEVAL